MKLPEVWQEKAPVNHYHENFVPIYLGGETEEEELDLLCKRYPGIPKSRAKRMMEDI